MKQFIYADNAATTKLDIDAFEAMKPYLLEEYGNASQPYSETPMGLFGNIAWNLSNQGPFIDVSPPYQPK